MNGKESSSLDEQESLFHLLYEFDHRLHQLMENLLPHKNDDIWHKFQSHPRSFHKFPYRQNNAEAFSRLFFDHKKNSGIPEVKVQDDHVSLFQAALHSLIQDENYFLR